MPTIQAEYLGQLRTQAQHLQSGQAIITDAPTDNHGRGEAFSPTDLLCASLGTCIVTTMGIKAQQLGLDLTGTQLDITKEMSADGPRRVRRVTVILTLPTHAASFSEHDRTVLERAAHTCPVALSLHPDVEQVIEFRWS